MEARYAAHAGSENRSRLTMIGTGKAVAVAQPGSPVEQRRVLKARINAKYRMPW
jgi:hypothetical protein